MDQNLASYLNHSCATIINSVQANNSCLKARKQRREVINKFRFQITPSQDKTSFKKWRVIGHTRIRRKNVNEDNMYNFIHLGLANSSGMPKGSGLTIKSCSKCNALYPSSVGQAIRTKEGQTLILH